MIEVIQKQDGGAWIIVKDKRVIDSNETGITGSADRLPNQIHITYARCWSGDDWEPQEFFAKQFESKDAAVLYAHQNRELLARP